MGTVNTHRRHITCAEERLDMAVCTRLTCRKALPDGLRLPYMSTATKHCPVNVKYTRGGMIDDPPPEGFPDTEQVLVHIHDGQPTTRLANLLAVPVIVVLCLTMRLGSPSDRYKLWERLELYNRVVCAAVVNNVNVIHALLSIVFDPLPNDHTLVLGDGEHTQRIRVRDGSTVQPPPCVRHR